MDQQGATQLLEELGYYADKPYDFVFWAFPWGEVGTELEHRSGPVGWQAELLLDLQKAYEQGQSVGNAAYGSALKEAYQIAIRSGHDVGKTAVLAWLIWWGISTREDTRGRATANTERQLKAVLQAECSKWHRMFIARDLFEVTATAIHAKDPERAKNWRLDFIPWSEENPEAFAGLHNLGKRIIIIFDEASAIHDKIWETTDGVAHEADTEIIWVCPGNPTRNYGRFYECFHKFRSEWHCYHVDSRDVPFTNKEKINRAIALWGVDSDYVKVRYLGDFPSASASQLISKEAIQAARKRMPQSFAHEPLVMTVDVARYGTNMSVIGFRRGNDAKSIPAQRFRGLNTIELGGKVVAAMAAYQPDAVFIDEGGVGGGVVDYVRSLGHHVIGVIFGAKASGSPGGVRCANKRTEMYVSLNQWLMQSGAIEDSDELEDELVRIEYYHQEKTQALILTPKDDMDGESPDWGDQLAMTFAFPVMKRHFGRHGPQTAIMDYNPLAAASEYLGDPFAPPRNYN